MEVLVPANAFEWVENCCDCHFPMVHVRLTNERLKLEPGHVTANRETYPGWFYEWSQKPCYMSGPSVFQEGDNPATAFPSWYCPRCVVVWVIFRGIWFKTSFAPAVPGGIVNAGSEIGMRDQGLRVREALAPNP